MSTPPDVREPLHQPPGRVNRRTLVAGAAGIAGVAGAGIFGIARAQDDTATPDAATDSPADATGTPDAPSASETAFATDALDRVEEVIVSVEADRDAAGSGIDLSEVDILIEQAGVHRDLAQTAIDAGDNAEAVRQAFVATGAARAARALIETSLDHPGLPSDEDRASRTLARIHAGIVAVTEEAASATDPNVGFFVSHAQMLYTSAYDLHQTGAFAQAWGTGRVAGDLAWIAMVLTPHVSQIGAGRGARGGGDIGGGRRGPARGGPSMPGMGGMFDGKLDEGFDDGNDPGVTPEAVPAPDFAPPATATV